MDEVLLTIHGTRHDLGRAVDRDGTVLDMLVQRRRTKIAAKTLFRNLLIGCQDVPRVIVTQGNVTNVKYLVATGFGFSGPLGRTNDFAGIAGSWGRAATDGHQSQWGFEAFSRFQLAPRLQFTPGYQIIVNPLEGSGDVVGIFEARLRVAF